MLQRSTFIRLFLIPPGVLQFEISSAQVDDLELIDNRWDLAERLRAALDTAGLAQLGVARISNAHLHHLAAMHGRRMSDDMPITPQAGKVAEKRATPTTLALAPKTPRTPSAKALRPSTKVAKVAKSAATSAEQVDTRYLQSLMGYNARRAALSNVPRSEASSTPLSRSACTRCQCFGNCTFSRGSWPVNGDNHAAAPAPTRRSISADTV